MNHDPDIYGADVNEFNPSRHLDSEGKIKPAIVDTKEESHGELLVFPPFEVMNLQIAALVSYGFGHRLCPGRLGLFSCTLRLYLHLFPDILQITRCLLTLQLSCGRLQ